ncbi:uncharacterized protein MKZ38_010642 [Zalerion maritima]|uniref:Uncharacterized protein n=1 Tax=Zalerion maritima TaxID=339359 RepID=A0AAD5RS41_9PEZI|nr:uncharacterized protein MKZ38_010642 [Zalerion maritima]
MGVWENGWEDNEAMIHEDKYLLTLQLAFLAELFPFSQRSCGISICQVFGTNVNPSVLVYFLLPETSDRTLEELAVLFEGDETAHRATEAAEKEIHHEDMD